MIQVQTAIRRINIRLYENVIATEITLPVIGGVILLFILNVGLDWNFVMAVQSVVFNDQSFKSTNDLIVFSKWSEIQVKISRFIADRSTLELNSKFWREIRILAENSNLVEFKFWWEFKFWRKLQILAKTFKFLVGNSNC